jgi:hypothetical protein
VDDDASFHPTELNPAQQQVLDVLGATTDAERPQFDAELRLHLHDELEAGLAGVVGRLPDDESLFLSKHQLTAVHGCEARLLAEEGGTFAWSVPLARGSVAHKAIELSIHWRGEPTPLELVDEAFASLAESDSSLAAWLRVCSEAERAGVRSQANDRVTKFLECFPPLSRRWRPVTESRLRAELADGRVVLRGQADLVLGRTEGTTARKVIVDLKTGGFAPSHLDDLRFYALLETIRLGVPPRLVASYYLDSGRPHPETVTEAVLESAVARTVDGADRLVALLHDGKPPSKRTGAACRWCPALAGCSEGRSFLEAGDQADAAALGLDPDEDEDDLDDPEDVPEFGGGERAVAFGGKEEATDHDRTHR